jgi:hypothetical protein
MLTLNRSYIAGQEVYGRYSHLVKPKNLPFVRASGSERVIDSATNWTAGESYVMITPFLVSDHQSRFLVRVQT